MPECESPPGVRETASEARLLAMARQIESARDEDLTLFFEMLAATRRLIAEDRDRLRSMANTP